MDVNFAYNIVDRKYIRVQEQQFANIKSLIQHLLPNPFIKKRYCLVGRGEDNLSKVEEGCNFHNLESDESQGCIQPVVTSCQLQS
jgi:hypothetical protein